jgi:undecaprenyl diphosphate synthase
VPQVPTHVAIIADGNRRWARERGLAPTEGHRAAYEQVFDLAEHVADRGVKYMTFFAFSTENWKRAKVEVDFLLGLLDRFVSGEVERLNEKGFRIRFFGSREGLSVKLAAALDQVQTRTADNTRATINICFNYGGRTDLVEAVQAIVREGVVAEVIDEAMISEHLSSHGTPPPDLVIRTSGEQRLSNFLIWEAAYAELIFVERKWPEFGPADIDEALAEFARRQRRFGA